VLGGEVGLALAVEGGDLRGPIVRRPAPGCSSPIGNARPEVSLVSAPFPALLLVYL
jgi:hypothetical protein